MVERIKKLIDLMKEHNIVKTFKDDVKRVTLSFDYEPGEGCPVRDPRRDNKKCPMCAKCAHGAKCVYDIAIPKDYLKGVPDMKEAEFEKYFGTELACYFRIRSETVEFIFMAGPNVARHKWWK
jgi:hypothetical protein